MSTFKESLPDLLLMMSPDAAIAFACMEEGF
jgi:hypothetical protein